MKKNMIPGTILVLIMAVLTYSCQRYESDRNFDVKNAEDGKTAKIVKYTGANTEIRIPSSILGQRITEIGEDAFTNKSITSVHFPKYIIKIEPFAFSGNSLSGVTIPKNMTQIDRGVFMDNKITAITIPDGVTKIGYRAFYMNPLTSITIGENVELETLASYRVFDLDFDDFYRANGRKAGTYTHNNDSWTLELK